MVTGAKLACWGGVSRASKGLQRRQVGTIVQDLAPGVCEVEFSDDQGRTYASAAFCKDQLMRLYHEPPQHAA